MQICEVKNILRSSKIANFHNNNMGYEKKLEGSKLRVSCISTLISYTTEVNKKLYTFRY